tara:strand:- start:137 stop:421 length:285 start_codon:yes stop_codon:yes gene_type:complete
MINESFVLLMLLGNPDGSYSERYIGKIPSCVDHAEDVIEKAIIKFRIPNSKGYICITNEVWKHRQRNHKCDEQFLTKSCNMPTPKPNPKRKGDD